MVIKIIAVCREQRILGVYGILVVRNDLNQDTYYNISRLLKSRLAYGHSCFLRKALVLCLNTRTRAFMLAYCEDSPVLVLVIDGLAVQHINRGLKIGLFGSLRKRMLSSL